MARDRLAAMRANQSNPISYGSQHPPSLPTSQTQPTSNQVNSYEMQEKNLDMENFMDQISDLNDTIQTINSSIDDLRQLHSKSLSQLNYSDPSSGPSEVTRDLNQTSFRTSQLIKSCKNRIESLNSQINSSPQPKHRFTVHVTQLKSVKKRLMDAIVKYQSVEQENRQKSEARIERQYRIVKPDATDEDIRQAIDSDQSVQIFSQALMTSNRYGDARAAFNEVKERHEQLKKIETTLTELMEMFNDLATMVEEQDHALDQVEQQAMDINKDTELAGQHISKARDSAAAARKKRWICFFIIMLLLIIAGVVIAVVVVTNNNKNKGTG